MSSFITDIPSPFFSNSRDKQNVKMIIRSAQFSFFSPKGKARRKNGSNSFSSDPIDRIYRYKKHIEQ